VQRSNVHQGPYVGVACPTGTSYLDSGLTNGTAYYYVVSGVFTGSPDAGGASANSSEATATPQGAAPTPPAPPTNLTARATKPGPINLQWVQSVTAGVTQNSIYRRTSETSYPSTPLATISATTSYHDGSVAHTTTYCYVVTARDAAAQSAYSNESCVVTH
jgi:cellulose 1,4-beta-cellobiosidase